MRLLRTRPVTVLVVLGCILLGAAVVMYPPAQPTISFEYAPLSDETFSPDVTVLGRTHRVALAVGILGGLLLAGAMGFALGRRSTLGPSEGDDGPRPATA
ncbi:hypothetical protein [Sanguibacter suaedae]|uniref:Uncharacterized protein n=1 Tax=Sanguibacter suaedae TaxID=2795737 RepID=A0A934M748_9MICO|nr:hypothetical protein [Sanguibacter suaedae]MBI9114987.1 hypothetical protein [Sanguibacter suaedae]